jgi:Flp pilus assembly protein TadD/predicted Ser/Thr protein kinase
VAASEDPTLEVRRAALAGAAAASSRGDDGAAPAAAPLRDGDPRRLGAYEVLGRLGEGGMGVVYLGRAGDGRLVALKVIRADLASNEEFTRRFQREVQAAQRVARFCTAQVIEAELGGEAPYLVTEYVPGPTLKEAVAEGGPLPASSLEGLAVGMAAALSAIHAAGVVHRDLKPSNVLLSQVGPRVIDFGIARARDVTTSLTRAGQRMGTPAFMAPEQFTGRPVSAAADVFAWGSVVAFAGTGRPPFGGGPLEAVAYRIVHDRADLAGVDDSLRELVEAATEKDPARRPSAQELLLRLLGHGAASPRLGDTRVAVGELLHRTWVEGDAPAAARQREGAPDGATATGTSGASTMPDRAGEPEPPATADLGLLLEAAGDLEGAEAAYREAAASDDPDQAPKAARNLGLLLKDRGDRDGAAAAYRRAIASGHPDQAPKAANNLGFLLAQSGDLDGAVAAYRWAVDSGHRDQAPAAARNLGLLHEQRGETDQARRLYQWAIDSGHPEEAPAAAANLVALLVAEGDAEGATAVFRWVADHPVYGPEAEANVRLLPRGQGD